ncbi:hypothetical protein [Roseicella aerolata]|uniref:Uncharacterized protein n=1 Tax=Roseicella aerolata TaxID=2883479 RepID=A0A9X1L8P6_9PROT|nr:hypothetical protein [Roseicella aerolata]MCB4823316.1 hypothetical protein [Roseicella aerolata]
MSEAPENLTLIHLRRLDERMDRMALDVQELKTRMTSVKQQTANLAATQASHSAILSARLDRVETRLDRIGRRLDLVEPAR